ncbi:uncharacterized protein LOC125812241 [Solanum verrucosum]|uniref:uncharacterized protein LOC125812241 n=1 Tax=Solanum verrucosum TaxID=315347 RepID=UPI0020D01AF6|nr:uncharacterized protein LOC125812241 [Solanum verrucosum]
MTAPPSLEEGQSITRTLCFNDQIYGWWKNRMQDYIMAEDSELWDVVLDGPYVPSKDVNEGDLTRVVPKSRREYDEINKKKIVKHYKAKKLLEGENIHEKHSRFTSITNELCCLSEPIHPSKKARKILRVFPKSWESKVNAITEARDLKTLTMDDLIGNLQTYELNKLQDSSKKEGKKDKSVALKASQNDASVDEEEMCGKPGHFMRDCPSPKHEFQDYAREDKNKRRDQVSDYVGRKANADQVVKKVFDVWGNPSSDSEESEHHEDVSMMAVKDEENVFNSMFSLMAKSDDEDDKDEVTLFDLKNDLDTLSIRRLRKLVAVLIDSVDELTTENFILSENLNRSEDEKTTLTSQLSEMNVRLSILETESHQTKEGPGTSESGKRKLSSFELNLVKSLKISESKLVAALKRNSQLANDLSKVKEELNQSLIWTDSSTILSKLANKKFNNGKGLGCQKIEPPYNPYSKYVFSFNNLLCTHYGKNGHLKRNCESLRKTKENQALFCKADRNKVPGPRYRFSKNNLPPWTRRFLIKPLDSFWELHLKWIPKANK